MKSFGRDFLDRIRKSDLLGEDAHARYSPPYRPLFSEEEIKKRNPRLAAVNIVLYLKDNEWYFPLMVRTHNKNDRHSGQISLPGGSREPQDENFAQTAIRETMEEIGIDKHYIRIIREISPIYIPPSNFYVYPFISYTKKNPKFILQKSEALELIEFPITSFLNLNTEPEVMELPDTRGQKVPVINFNGYIIWGATSMILSEFSHLLKNL